MENSEFKGCHNWILTAIHLTEDTATFDNLMKIVCAGGSPIDTPELREYVKLLQGEIKLNKLLGIKI